MIAFLKRWFRMPAPIVKRPKAERARLAVEVLEDRWVPTAISVLYGQVGGASGFLGKALAPERNAPDQHGREQFFEHGAILWSPKTEAHYLLNGSVLQKYLSLGAENFGYPTQNQSVADTWGQGATGDPTAGGVIDYVGLPRALVIEVELKNYNTDAPASIVDVRGRGTFAVAGSYWTSWQNLRQAASTDFVPTDEPHLTAGKTSQVQDFVQVNKRGPYAAEGVLQGAVYVSQAYGAHFVGGNCLTKYRELGEDKYGLLTDDVHFPVNGKAEEINLKHVSGTGATIAWSSLTGAGAHETHGVNRDNWLRDGGDRYEVPVTDESTELGPALPWWNFIGNLAGLGTPDRHYCIYQNLTTGRLYKYWNSLDGTGWVIGPVAPLYPTGLQTQSFSPVTLMPQTSGRSDLVVTGRYVGVFTGDPSFLILTVDGVRYQFAKSTVGTVFVDGAGTGSTLTVDDAAHAGSAWYMGYVVDKDHVAVNGLSIYYDDGVKNVTLKTSNTVTSGVNIASTNDHAPVTVIAGTTAATTVSAAFTSPSPFGVGNRADGTALPLYDHLLSPVTVYGNARTALTTSDEYTAAPQFAVTANAVAEVGAGQINFWGVASVTVNGNAGADAFDVLTTGSTPITLHAATGDATVRVSNPYDGADDIRGALTVQGGTGHDTLIVDDTLGSIATYPFYRVDESTLHLPTGADVHYDGLVDRVVLRTSANGAASIEVDGSAAATALEIDASATTAAISAYFEGVGGHELLGNVSIIGNGLASLAVRDAATTPHHYTLREGSLGQEGRGTISYAGLASLFVQGSAGDDRFDIEATTAGVNTSVNAMDGNNVFSVGDADGTLDHVQGALTLTGKRWSPATSYLEFNDAGNPIRYDYGLTDAQLTRDGMASITFNQMDQVVLDRAVGFVTVDAAGLAGGFVFVDGVSYETTAAAHVELTPGKHTLSAYGGDAVTFTVNDDGTVGYAPALEGILTGQGTRSLQVVGVAVTVDAHLLSGSYLFVDYQTFDLSGAGAFTLNVLPGAHWLNTYGGDVVNFTASASGKVGYDAALQGVLAGRGTQALAVNGRAVKLDAHLLSGSYLFVDYAAYDSTAAFTARFLPGTHWLNTYGGDPVNFTVSVAGKVGYDTGLQGVLAGRGTKALTVSGRAVKIDAHLLSGSYLFVDYAAYDSTAAFTARLLPGTHWFNTYGGDVVNFTVDLSGAVGYDAAFQTVLAGQGSKTLTVNGAAVQIDARTLGAAGLTLDYVAFDTTAAFTARLLPGEHALSVGDQTISFIVRSDGTLDFDAALDGLLAGRGTKKLILLAAA